MAFKKVFVDADVVIEFFTDRQPFANPASEIFHLADMGSLEIFISAASVNNIYYITRKYLGHNQAVQVIEALVELTDIVDTTKQEIFQALKNNFKDFEDSIQYSSALTIEDVDAILTRNVKDYLNSEIAVFTPEDYLGLIS